MSEERVEYRVPGEGRVARVRVEFETAVPLDRIAGALAEIAREGAMRRWVYPAMISNGKLGQVVAERQIAALQDAWRIVNAVAGALGIAPEAEPVAELPIMPRCGLCGGTSKMVPAPNWGGTGGTHTYYECDNDECENSMATVYHAFIQGKGGAK